MAREKSQAEMRRGIEIDKKFSSVTSVTQWYRGRHFESEAEARGAFKLAHQQALDGMGSSSAAWMGMTNAEYEAWMRRDELPAR